MTPKIKERWVNTGLAVLSGAAVAFLAFFLSTSEGRTIRIKDKLEEKAPYGYVDDRDNEIRHDFSSYKTEHVVTHSVEMQAVQGQLDILVKWVESEGRGD